MSTETASYWGGFFCAQELMIRYQKCCIAK